MKKYNIKVNGSSYMVEVEEISEEQCTSITDAQKSAGEPVRLPSKPGTASAPKGGTVNAPMPGTVLEVKVSAGQKVKSGDTLLIMEAMKMENEIPAPYDGTVTSVAAVKGAAISAGDVLVIIE